MMSDFDYALDVDEEYQGQEDGFQWDNPSPGPGPGPGPMFNRRRSNNRHMNAQYNEAFGNYRGGYGPGCGYGYPRPRPYPPGPPRGGGYGPMGYHSGPPIHRAAHFLAKCDIALHYIKPLPWHLLEMIAPDYCGLCAQNLDSFPLAKIHYNSKNHYKAQKKFLLNKTSKNQTEVPLKARNLYCELCDVHITSTSHADSHYAGKSHRSIVEGRKPPKNPLLLQDEMEGRVDQLIRREKKNIKTAPEAVSLDDKDLDSAPPELVCQICKTTVTCSEQMTNHLNGKRHLSKEKHHILNMMKGKNNEKNGDDKKEEDYTADVEEGEEQPANVDPAAEHADDWASGGGGDWDSHNTTQLSDQIEGSSASESAKQ